MAACGTDSDPAGEDGGSATSDGEPPAGVETTEPPGSADTTVASSTPTSDSEPAPTPSTDSTSPTTTGPALDGKVAVGEFAPTVLRPDRSERLVIELHADQAPNPETVEHLRTTLASVSGKSVEVADAAAPGAGDREWDAASLRDAADRGAVVPQGGGVAVLRLLFVHGSFERDDRALGVAVRGDLAAVFVDRVEEAAGVLGSAAAFERSVETHELGHLLGLVDLYLDTGRADPEHPGHSTNRNSVMHWAVESDVIGQVLGANPPDSFDSADRADLEAIRAGA